MEKINLRNEESKIDNIINQALVDYMEELDESNINEWNFTSQESFLLNTYNKHTRKSTAFINTSFPDIETSVIQNAYNNNCRFLLYGYASARNEEFDKINSNFINLLNGKV